jgi:hypothetical protein
LIKLSLQLFLLLLEFCLQLYFELSWLNYFLYVVCIIFSINIICSFEDKALHFLVLALWKFITNFIPIFKWKLCTNIVYIYMFWCSFHNLKLPFLWWTSLKNMHILKCSIGNNWVDVISFFQMWSILSSELIFPSNSIIQSIMITTFHYSISISMCSSIDFLSIVWS